MNDNKVEISMQEDVKHDPGHSDLDKPTPFRYSSEEKHLVKKMTWILLPLVWCVILIQFVDKSILSVAAATGLFEDTHINKAQYSWSSSIVYLGVLVYQIPNNILIQRLPHSRYLGALILFWGIVTAATCVVDSFAQLMTVRFLLGLLEAGCSPIIYIILNNLYRRSEQSAVFGFILVSSGSGSAVGAAMGYGIVQTLDHVGGWRAWRWAYLIFGVCTVFLGIVVFFFLVDSPTSKLLRLSDKEREIVQHRINDNKVVKTKTVKRAQIWEALKESRFWLLCLATTLNGLQNGGLVSYSILLVHSLGFSQEDAILLQIPSGVSTALCVFVAVLIARRTKQTIYTAILMTIVSILGLVVLVVNEGVAGKLAGYYLSWAGGSTHALIITIVGNNVSGYTKKVTYNCGMIVATTLGNFIGPLIMAPSYIIGLIVFIAVNILVIMMLLFVRWRMARLNRQRQGNPQSGMTDPHLDYTDREDITFVYRL